MAFNFSGKVTSAISGGILPGILVSRNQIEYGLATCSARTRLTTDDDKTANRATDVKSKIILIVVFMLTPFGR
jgi:hypothetical protein